MSSTSTNRSAKEGETGNFRTVGVQPTSFGIAGILVGRRTSQTEAVETEIRSSASTSRLRG